MRCAAASRKLELGLRLAHRIGEGAAAGDDDAGDARAPDDFQNVAEAPALRQAAAELDDGRPHDGAHGLRGRTISTPTAPGPRSSFSTRTSTDTMRLSARQRSAMRSANVSTRLMWPAATMAFTAPTRSS